MDRRVIRQLNDIRASEQRMSLLYRRCAEQATGPYRNALAEEFLEHAADEDQHAAHAQRHIIALGGDLDADVAELPVWRSVPEMLSGLEKLEEKGVRLWQELLRMLPEDDAFRHTVEEVLSKEQEHWDDVRRLLREDQVEKSMIDKTVGDIGSIVPLNINQRAIIPTTMSKSEPHAERIERAARAGTPPTRRGMFNGAMPATQPGVPAELNPPLVISKAVVNPKDAGSGSGDSAQRKRDPNTGKFAETQNAGPQTTAKEDLAAQQRTARLAERRYLKSMGMDDQQMGKPSNPMDAAGIPGAPPGQGGVQLGASQPQGPAQGAGGPQQPPGPPTGPAPGAQPGAPMGEQPIGQAPDGTPIFADPYNPAHSSFTPEQHDAAAQLHQQLAEQMTGQGRIAAAMEHQMQAAIHAEMGRDAMSPMSRMAMDQQGVQGLSAKPGQVPELTGASLPPGAGGPNSNPAMGGQGADAMDQFLTNLPDQIPGGQNRPGGPNDVPGGAGAQVAGPEPRMMNTFTGGPVGPLTPPQNHAGTMATPEEMPDGPPPGGGSMPEIGQPSQDPMAGGADDEEMGPGLEEAGLQSGDSFDWDPSALDDGDGDEGMGADGDGDGDEDPDAGAFGGAPDASPQDADGPTPGSSESEPGDNAGPSTEDKPPAKDDAEKAMTTFLAGI